MSWTLKCSRPQRDPVIGRNNFQGFRIINGADTAMTFYTIVRTCKQLSLPAKPYMVVMATRAARGERALTPLEWAKALGETAKTRLPAAKQMAQLI